MSALSLRQQRVFPALRPARSWLKSGLSGAGIAFGALLLGLMIVFLPWWLMLGLLGAVVYPLVLLRAPWAGVFVYFAALELSPDLKASDALTGCTLLFFGVQWLASRQRFKLPTTELRLFVAFIVLVLVSLVMGLVVAHNTVPFVYRDGRAFMYWLWLPLLFWLAHRQPEGLRKLGRVLVLVACLVSVIALIQYLFGLQIVREGRVGSLETGNVVDVDATRVQMPGFTYVLVALAWATANVLLGGKRVFYAMPLALLFVAALYVNFGRALWAWSFFAVLICGAVLGLRRAFTLLALLLVSGSIAVGGLLAFKPSVVDNAVTRLSSVVDEGGNKSSYGWRKLENESAVGQIIRHPVLGLGLGAEYRAWVADVRLFTEHTRYIHNAYLFIATKIGIPALLILVTLLLRIWWSGFRLRHDTDFTQDPVWVACVAGWWSLLGMSVTQPELLGPHSIFLLCLLSTKLLAEAQARREPTSVLR